MKHLDLGFVRSCFPAFEQSPGKDTAFFENAGGSYVLASVIERLNHFYRVNKVQPYGESSIGRMSGEQMDAGRQSMVDLLGMPADTITLGPSTTQNVNTLALACASIVDSDSEVIVSEQDHEANIGAWERLCQRQGARFRLWEVSPKSGELDLADLRSMLGPAVKVVCVTHSSNIIGTINPVEEVVELCRAHGARIVVDGVSFVPHQWPNLSIFQPDAYVFSTYKTWATHLGVMYCARDFAEVLDPQCHYFNKPYREKWLDAAGPDHASIAALAGLEDYFEASHQHHIGERNVSLKKKAGQASALMHKHEQELCEQLIRGLEKLPIRIIGKNTTSWREANVALVSKEHSPAEMNRALAARDIAVGHGHFYAVRLLKKLGIDVNEGVLRISLAHYNTEEEIERLLAVMTSLH